MDEERTKPPAQPAATAGAAARAILATSAQHALRHAAGVAKLGLALTRRPGHVIVTCPDGRVGDALLRAAESQVGALRLVRGTADERHVDDLLRSLRGVGPGERVAGVVGDADRLSAAALARLHAGVDAGALERGDVRLVLLGRPALVRTLRDERLRPLMAHVCLHLDVPAADEPGALPAPVRSAPVAARRTGRGSSIRRLEVAGIAAAIVVGIGLWTWFRPGPPPPPSKPVVDVASPPEASTPAVEEPAEAPVVVHVDRSAPRVDPDRTAVAAPPTVVPPPVAATPPSVVVPPPVAVALPPTVVPPPVAAPAPRAARARAGLGLQVGAFARPENATRLAARLGRRFGRVEVTEIVRGARTLHRVRIVGLASEAERRAVARRLAAEGLEPLPVR